MVNVSFSVVLLSSTSVLIKTISAYLLRNTRKGGIFHPLRSKSALGLPQT